MFASRFLFILFKSVPNIDILQLLKQDMKARVSLQQFSALLIYNIILYYIINIINIIFFGSHFTCIKNGIFCSNAVAHGHIVILMIIQLFLHS